MFAQIKSISLACAISIPLISGHEGLVKHVYKDQVGVETYCYGETQDVEYRDYTETECMIRLINRVAKDYEAPLKICVDNWVDIPVESRSALISLTYNLGAKAICNSSSVKAFEEGDFVKGCEKIKLWNKIRQQGRLKVSQGLVNRREVEYQYCMEGISRLSS